MKSPRRPGTRLRSSAQRDAARSRVLQWPLAEARSNELEVGQVTDGVTTTQRERGKELECCERPGERPAEGDSEQDRDGDDFLIDAGRPGIDDCEIRVGVGAPIRREAPTLAVGLSGHRVSGRV